MKLSELRLENFQAHEDLRIQFSPTITTIKGTTDVGKSAILRALRLVSLNDIAGTHFVRNGAKKTTVTLIGWHKKEKHMVVRVKNRDGATNTYELDGAEMKAFGQGVPPDVAAFLRLGDINFQDQHDSPFWFKETGGEVSRRLNSIVDLSIIDTALSNVAGAVKAASVKKDAADERLADAEFKLAQLAPQRARVFEFETLAQARITWRRSAKRAEKLNNVLSEFESLAEQHKELGAKLKDRENLLEHYRKAIELSRKIINLNHVMVKLEEKQSALDHLPPDFTPVSRAHGKVERLANQITSLSDVLSDIQASQAAVTAWTSEISVRETTLCLRTKGEHCPLCGHAL